MIRFLLFTICAACMLGACTDNTSSRSTAQEKEITLYTHRHYDTDKQIFEQFTREAGVKVNVVQASADELIQKLESEGEQSPADVLITVDAGRMVRAKNKGLLQPVASDALTTAVPSHLRDGDGEWYGVTKRARIIVYDKDKVDPAELSTYEALSDPKWRGKVLIRASGNIYNQSLMASIIANDGRDAAKQWARDIVKNMARAPKGNDRDQVKAVLGGEGELAVINTYYLGNLLNSQDSLEVAAGNSVSIFFPNQDDRGTHINISGIGVAKHAPNKEDAIRFIEYLVSKEVQETFAQANYEYPVNPAAQPSKLLSSWGNFKEDNLPLSKLGELNRDAVMVFDEVAWDKGPDVE